MRRRKKKRKKKKPSGGYGGERCEKEGWRSDGKFNDKSCEKDLCENKCIIDGRWILGRSCIMKMMGGQTGVESKKGESGLT